ncbi:MAG: acyltransferase [Gammaproteobacteria bacterium]|nr:acyltransferase [Gammaproteobacteria bacterium]
MQATDHSCQPSHFLPALSGIRFFAIFPIFVYHLWSVYEAEKQPPFGNLLISFKSMPKVLVDFFSHGYLSLSFFFVLSGFILAYHYWSPEGSISQTPKRFWFLRFSRIYPIHIIVAVPIMIMTIFYKLSLGMPVSLLAGSAITTITLTQAWYAPYVPILIWPAWMISALVFLYFLTPWLMQLLTRLTRQQMIGLLLAAPFVSLIPTFVYVLLMMSGFKHNQNSEIFFGSLPLFWIPHFVAGMLLSRVFSISRFNNNWRPPSRKWLAWGDLAIVIFIVITCLPKIDQPLKFVLVNGLLMPLYLIMIIDMAKGNGLFSRLLSLPGMRFLGEISYSMYIWQNMVIAACFAVLMINEDYGKFQLIWACISLVLISAISTRLIENPIAKILRNRFLS